MPDVGILFVHGVGNQPKGDTLLGFAEPVVDWLDRWLRRRAGEVEVLETRGGGPLLQGNTPAHARVRVAPRAQPEQEWLLAESWWATEFQPPKFGTLAAWLLTRGSWLILSHAGRGVRLARGRDALGKAWRFVGALLFFASAVPLALLVQAIVLVLAAVALVPVKRLRAALSGVLLTLTGTIGDSYVVVESILRRHGVSTRLRHDLEWLHAQRCEKIVVVAHSQGGAVAHFTLRRPHPTVDLLVTFGSGLAKLQELFLVSTRDSALLRLAMVTVPAVALVLLFLDDLLRALLGGGPLMYAAGTTLALTGLGVGTLLVSAFQGSRVVRAYDYAFTERPQMPWLDCYATADPVPHGPLRDEPVACMTSEEVANRRHPLLDHNAYWSNTDEFIPLVLRSVDKTVASGLFDAADRTDLDAARHRRARRTSVLLSARTLTFAAIGIACLGLDLAAIGRATLGWLDGQPVIGGLHGVLQTVGGHVGGILAACGVGDAARHALGHGAVGVLVPAALLLLWHVVVVGSLWRIWNTHDVGRLLEQQGTPFVSRSLCGVVTGAMLVALVMAIRTALHGLDAVHLSWWEVGAIAAALAAWHVPPLARWLG